MFILLAHSDEACCEVLYERSTRPLNWTNNHLNELGRESCPVKLWNNCSFVKEPKLQELAKAHLNPDAQKMWDDKCCFNLLSVVAICYAAVDN